MIKRLTVQQAQEIYTKNGFELFDGRLLISGAKTFITDVSLSPRARALAIAARLIADAFKDLSCVVLLIDEWDVWPTEEFSALLAATLSGFGDPRNLQEAPAFECTTKDEAKDLVRLALLSGWSGCVFATQNFPAFRFDDDEWISISHPSQEIVAKWSSDYLGALTDTKQLWSGER